MSIREEKKRKTKKAILESAIALFNRNGYESTSIEEIAKAAGIGKGTVYGYFQTKRDIIKGFCDYELEQVHAELSKQTELQASLLEQMLTIFMTEFQFISAHKEFGRMFMREAVFPSEHELDHNHEIDNKYFALIFPLLAQAQERGELRKDCEHLHICGHFYGLYIMVVSAWYTGHIPTEEAGDAMRLLFTQAMEGLKANNVPTLTNEDINEHHRSPAHQ